MITLLGEVERLLLIKLANCIAMGQSDEFINNYIKLVGTEIVFYYLWTKFYILCNNIQLVGSILATFNLYVLNFDVVNFS